MLFAALTAWAVHPSIWVLFVMLIPMVADGLIQLLTRYESTNLRRLVTGVLFGYSFAILLVLSAIAAYEFGAQIGRTHFS